MFARKIQVEVLEPQGPRPCPLAWLDSFCMRSFTGRSAFDETLPLADGLMEASLRVDMEPGNKPEVQRALVLNVCCGFAAPEIAARIAEEAFERLDAPVMRVAAKDAPVPYGPLLENAMLPQESDVAQALTRLARY